MRMLYSAINSIIIMMMVRLIKVHLSATKGYLPTPGGEFLEML